MIDLTEHVQAVKDSGCDAWMLYDFRGSNQLAWSVLKLPSDAHCTRRWAVVIMADGTIRKLTHAMEQHPIAHVPGETTLYSTREQWQQGLKHLLHGCSTIAAEYSPYGNIPTVSMIDAGLMDLLRSIHVDVVSSADLAQKFTAVLTVEQITDNQQAAHVLKRIVLDAFVFVREAIRSQGSTNEYAVQQYIVERFAQHSLVSDSRPIVAIGPNAASPHYAPSAHTSSEIGRDMVVLIDAWARTDTPKSVYADITWVGFTGTEVPTAVEQRFNVLVRARDAAVDLCAQRFLEGRNVQGYELDDACRSVIANEGLDHLFIHRTGHNIHTSVHGPGANLDNFETHDTRSILRGTSFSVEPGVYEQGVLGLRTELDVMVDHDGTVIVTTAPVQTHVLPIMHELGIPT